MAPSVVTDSFKSKNMNEPQPFPTNTAKPKTGLSVTSLVLGILSIACFFIFTGIPAVITGHIARGRAKREPGIYGGAGMALAGLIMGYLSVVTTLLAISIGAALVLPALAKMKAAQSYSQQSPCVNNLKQINLAARIWSNDHGDKFPPDFLTMSNELATPNILVCDADSKKTAARDWAHFDPSRNVTYEYLLPGAKEEDAMQQPAFRCPIHGNVCLGDGTIQNGASKRQR